MIAEFGVVALVIVLLASAMGFSFFLGGRWQVVVATCLPACVLLQALMVSLAFASLMILRLESDFSVVNVAEHSNRVLPLLYKLVGTWGNHEGSMLLWLLVMTSFSVGLSFKITSYAQWVIPALAVQSGLVAGTCGFVLFTSNPFARVFPPPADGNALNPLLQDVGLAIHPPLLYLGYVGFSLVFSLAVAALFSRKAGREWAQLVHPWILLAWSGLTAGIALGSWWAYRELGWGGWWFWDPVENASLLPWLAGLALLHSNIVMKKRDALAGWVVLLAIVTFALSLIGTFLVRSGALTSVHSFASDPARGMYILAFIVLSIGIALALYAWRAGDIQSSRRLTPSSRGGLIVLNNTFLMVACATVLFGTLYPLAVDWFNGQPVTVGAPYFNLTFLPLMALPLCLAAIAPFAGWDQHTGMAWLRPVWPALVAVLAACLLVLAWRHTAVAATLVGVAIAVWLGVASITLWCRVRSFSVVPVGIAHMGAALLVAGITMEGTGKIHAEQWLLPQETITIADYTITLDNIEPLQRRNHKAIRAQVTVRDGSGELAQLYPEYRRYDIRNTTTSEAAIFSGLLADVYVVVGEFSGDQKRLATRVYVVPLVSLIWIGFAFMALGGILAALQTRKEKYIGKAGI
ncbi:MAG: heme lyase CcmF/NrfE family subunit [Alphaproteobacteria bacterium]